MSAVILNEPAWLTDLRAEGAAQFGRTGLPTQRQEAWKYTGLNRLKSLTFEPTPSPQPSPRWGEGAGVNPRPNGVTAEPSGEGAIAAAHILTFINGRYTADKSTIGTLPNGVILGSLAELLAAQPELLESHLGRTIDIARKPLVALNTGWIEDGLVLIVPRGISIAAPITVNFVADGAAPVAHPRLVVSLGDTAEAVLIERHLHGGASGFSNQVAEIALGSGAHFRHYVLHIEPDASFAVESVAVTVERDASYRSFALTAGAGLVRREVEVALKQPGASAQVDGAYLVDGDRHADTTILIDHQAAHCSSRQTQKGIIDDDGRAVFQGKILVRPDAQKTDGYQLSQTLLLSPRAEIDVKPELEIHADDVKCSHGATVGRLDADALFFLRARGIPEGEARALLIQGFIGSALDEIDRADIREDFVVVAANWLRRNSESHS